MSATAGQADGVRSLADRLGIEPSMVVMELGYDDDVDEELREAVMDRAGELLLQETVEDGEGVHPRSRDGNRAHGGGWQGRRTELKPRLLP